MANENELQIVLNLIDNASTELKKITEGVKKDTQEVTKETEKATKSIKEQFKEASSGLREIRRASFIAVIAIGTIIASVKEAAKYNLEAKKSFDEFTLATKNLSVTLGSSLTQGLEGITALIKFLNTILETTIAGFVKAFSFVAEFFTNLSKGPVEAYKRAIQVANIATDNFINKIEDTKNIVTRFEGMKIKMQEMNDVLSQLNLSYLTGAISAQQYYDVLSSNNVANFQNMQMQMTLMQQVAMQENLMRNQSLMDYSADVTARMQLLKTLQTYHHTVYSTMMDFTNLVITKISSGMSSALTGIIMGTKKAGEAWKEFGTAMVTAIIEFVIQYAIQTLLMIAMGWLMARMVINQANSIGAAWAEPAALACLATLGLNAIPAAAALIGTSALAAGLAAKSAVTSAAFSFGGGATGGTGASGGFAEGGWAGLGGPERILVGERGPEYVVPNNRLNQVGQTSIHIEINNPIVSSKDDIDYLTEEISRRLARETERL